MKLGAEPKKIAILGGLLAVAAVLLYVNVFSEESAPAGSVGTVPAAAPAPRPVNPAAPSQPGTATTRPNPRGGRQAEFRPSLKRNADDPLDVSKVDPSLRLEALAKLQTVTMTTSGRNLFEFASPPPPTLSKLEPPKKIEPKIIPGPPLPPPPVAKFDPPKPQAPPIPLKFYGFISSPKGAQRRGFFLDGEDILVAGEGDTIKRRYKVVRIGLNSVEMEDIQFSQSQTLRLVEAPGV